MVEAAPGLSLSEREIEWAADATRFRMALSPGRVDVLGAIRSSSIALLLYPFGSESLEGGYQRDEFGQAYIVVNSSRPVSRQRFTAAHELGHHILHGDRIDAMVLDEYLPEDGDQPADPIEEEAEIFASRFLMDERSTRTIASEVAELPSARITAQVGNGVAVRMAVLFLLLGQGPLHEAAA